MTEISQELAQRMASFVRKQAEVNWLDPSDPRARPMYEEARAIVALLPQLVDPDLIEAREMFIELEGGVDADGEVVSDVRQGKADSTDEVRHILAGIKRGRELAAQS